MYFTYTIIVNFLNDSARLTLSHLHHYKLSNKLENISIHSNFSGKVAIFTFALVCNKNVVKIGVRITASHHTFSAVTQSVVGVSRKSLKCPLKCELWCRYIMGPILWTVFYFLWKDFPFSLLTVGLVFAFI